ncbi:MAG TPA: hypothetical protein VJ179_02360, partial [Patescibacteria group bacterium]|nr:hypothetical protein [Patescibacteria group bacterium]
MRVLLVSPKDPQVPTHLKYLMGGENTYTQSLLSHPPNGVTYTHHTDALSAGIISHTMWQHLFTWTMKARLLPPDAGFHCLEIHDHVDLIHSHVYGLKLETKHIPVVLSDSSSNMLFLRDYLGWGERKIQHSYFIRRWMAGGLNVYDPNLYLHDAHRLVVWSEFAKNIHVSLGADPEKIVVIPPGIAPLPFPKRKQQDAFTVLFIGVWFERKGGPLVLEVFRRL